jgi:hypothetical protein
VYRAEVSCSHVEDDPVAQCARRAAPETKGRAAKAERSLSEYLIRKFRWVAERPTRQQMMRRLKAAESVIDAITNDKPIR